MGSRGLSGKTFAMATLGLTAAVVLGANVLIAAGSTSQTKQSIKHMQKFWSHPNAPSYMLKDDLASEMRLTNGAIITSVTSSERGLRSAHPQWLLLDEIDEWGQGRGDEGFTLLESAQGMPMDDPNWLGVKIPAQVAATSTLQRVDGPFRRLIDQMEDQDEKLYSWCYKESSLENDGWLSEDLIEKKRSTLSKDRWEREYELNEVSADHLAIDSEAVEKMFKDSEGNTIHVTDHDVVKKQGKKHEEYFFESYSRNEDYVISADWARVKDFSVINVWKMSDTPCELVYYCRMRDVDWPDQVKKFNEIRSMYGDCAAVHDATGIGDVIGQFFEGQYNIIHFKMAGEKRSKMLNNFIVAVEQGKLRAPKIDSLYRSLRYTTHDDVFSSGDKYHLPDEFCAAGLAWWEMNRKFPAALVVGLPKVESTYIEKGLAQNKMPTDKMHKHKAEVDEHDHWDLLGGYSSSGYSSMSLERF